MSTAQNKTLDKRSLDMDAITLAVTTALANLSQNLIKDAYVAFKAALQDKFGVNSELIEAVDKLEQKPDSKARQAMLQEEVAGSGAGQDQELLQLANELIEQLKQLSGGKVDIRQDVNIKGDRNIVTGQGDVTVND
jgi:hypothetical protein